MTHNDSNTNLRPVYLSRAEAADFLKLAPSTLANRASAGLPPAHFVPPGTRRVLYDLAELRQFVEAGRVQTMAAR